METFKKRQKASARREKQQKKAARRMERRHEKASLVDKIGENNSAGSTGEPNAVRVIGLSIAEDDQQKG